MNTRKICLLSAGLLTLTGGCTVGPDYHPPQAAAPKKWSESQRGGTTNTTVKVVEWWRTFHDAELNSLIERAVQANLDLRIAEGRVREARATRSGALWDFGPTINSSTGYTRQKGALQRQSSGLHDTNLDASWEIDVFGSKRRTLEADTANLAASEEDRRDVLVILLGDVARNYMEVRGAQQRLAIARKNITAQSESIELTRTRFKAGLTSELDVKQAEALLATTQATIPTFETAQKQAVHQLSVLLGQPPGALLAELSRAKPIPPTPPSIPVGMPSDLLRRRPDVRRAERQLAAATANIGVETAELFPKFSLTGTGGFQSVSASDWLTAGSRYWSAGPTVTWRFLDFGRIRARIKAADARQEQALATYEKTVLTAFQDVENALVAYANEQSRFKALNESVTANRRALELANELYSKGLGDFLSVLDSERSLFGAEDQLADSQRTVTENLTTLYKALGGGWETGRFALR